MLWMDKTSFNYILDNFPVVARNLVRILSARVRLSDQMIQSLATLDVNGRLARQLLAFSERYGRETPDGTKLSIVLTQSDLAGLVGASRKRVNQTMVFFKEQGIVSTDPEGQFIIHKAEKLAAFCD